MSFCRPHSESSAGFNVDKRFDVFLSFRGPDTREGFTNSLYDALCREQIHAFLDRKSLEKGDHIPTGLCEGIKESRICIPIFSKRFAESKWCLREVSLMVESRVKICPVFYEVSRADLHCSCGSKYAEDLKSHENDTGSKELILEWEGSLQTVAGIPGWCSSGYSSDSDLIQDIMVEIRKILHSNSPLNVLDVPKCFGLERSVEYLKGLLNAAHYQPNMVKLGILGISGIGKTTLAKVICKEIFPGFEKICFVLSVGERCQEADGLVKLQTRMLKDVSYFRGEVGYVEEGKCLLQEYLRGKKVLLLLDDIQSHEQLDALGGNCSHFGAGSRLIITSQNEQILRVAEVDEVYRVRSLRTQKALRMFKFHAFPESYCPDQELETLCNDIVAGCEGLPFYLQIFGKLLFGIEDRDVWKEMAAKLRNEKSMQKKLRVSYDALDRHEKEMFQDIACLMTWMKKEIAMIFWADQVIQSPRACLRNLFDKSLVELGPGNELVMHPCLRDLGRSIADEMNAQPRKRSRLFNEDDVAYVLGRPREKAKHVRYLSYEPREPMILKAEMFNSLYNLRLLWLTNVAIEGHFSEESSLDQLRWVRLRRYSSKQLPVGVSLQNLVILEVTNSEITHLWDETEENSTIRLLKLKLLILSGCETLQCLPGTLCHSPLQKLDLHSCHSLKSLPDTVGSWTSLVSLDMEGCSISSLPQDFGNLINLQELKLSHCQHLSKLPTSFGNLSRLEKLEIHHNSKLAELPESFGGLKTLAFLDMERCSVSYLPQDFGELLNLEELNLSCCQHLSELPPNFGNLNRLERLEMHHNCKLTELPNNFGNLQTLAYLDVSYCGLSNNVIAAGISELSSLRVLHLEGNGIHHLPDGFENLKQLEELNLDNCGELSVLSGFPSSLKVLFARNCKSLHTFSCHAGRPCLMTLELTNSCNLAHFHGLQRLEQLEKLNLVGCNNIPCETLVNSLCGLTALEYVYFGGPGVLSTQLNKLYDCFKVHSFSKNCLMDNLDPTANWISGEAVGKRGNEKMCIEYCADEDKECVGYIACILSLGKTYSGCKASPPAYTLSYTIQRDESLTQCPVKHQSSAISSADFLEVRLVRTNNNIDFPWLKSGNKLRVQAMSDYENWKASYNFLMCKAQCVPASFQKDKIPKMITFVM